MPNIHPVFVHFTIALLTSSAALFVAARLFAAKSWSGAALSAGYWNLWLGAGCTVATVYAGFVAFDSVGVSDAAVRAAMEDHRNWAWATFLLYFVLACWSAVMARGAVRLPFLALMLLATALLTATGWKGGELVYRHGVGVAPVEARR